MKGLCEVAFEPAVSRLEVLKVYPLYEKPMVIVIRHL